MGTAPGLLRLLQVRPRLILLRAVPVGKRRLAQQRTFGRTGDWVVLQDRYKRAPRRREMHGLEQAHIALLIDHSLDRLNHRLFLCAQCTPYEPRQPNQARASPLSMGFALEHGLRP
ncbi:hypothetical protein SBA4_2250010 [Candidatus Sulfopaludibacter sp. SbA4]|nr:hypothetical protein SBA4_2250010 [Candidatus Sulfopaludibacter sp. SbA4]